MNLLSGFDMFQDCPVCDGMGVWPVWDDETGEELYVDRCLECAGLGGWYVEDEDVE